MLTAIDPQEGRLWWDCLLYAPLGRLRSCGQARSCALSEAVYSGGQALPSHEGGGGQVIALPRCPDCGTQVFLKADYSLDDMAACLCEVRNDAGLVWAYVLPLGHTRNLLAHALLYDAGLAPAPPLITPAPLEFLSHPRMTDAPHDVGHALWFGFVTAHHLALLRGGAPSTLLLPPGVLGGP